MRIPSASDIKRIVLQNVQPLKSGVIESIANAMAKLTDIPGFGTGSAFRTASPFGFISQAPKGVVAFVLNLGGKAIAPIIVTYLDKNRPEPSGPGETVLYSLDPSGQAVKVKITLGADGTLTVVAPTKILLECTDVELGTGTLQKIINGEAFQAWANAHVHLGNLGAPTMPPTVPSGPTHLSSQVKAGP